MSVGESVGTVLGSLESVQRTMVSAPPGGAFLVEPIGAAVILTPELLTEDQQLMKETADEFMRREVEPRVAEIEAKRPGLMRELLQKAAEVGLLAHDVPERWGGLGGDKVSSSLITEAIGTNGSFAVSFGAHAGIGTMPLVLYGTPEQKARWLPRLASGDLIAAYSLTEPGSGSDALGARTRAVLSSDGTRWHLSGTKQYTTNAGFADLFTVFAKVDGQQFTAFLVERDAPGFAVGPEEHKLGIRGSSTCALYLEDCVIPVENVLGKVGEGHKIAFNILNLGRWKLGVGAVGSCKLAMQLGVSYARERKQFNRPIAEFDLIRKKIAESAVLTYVAESVAYRTAGLIDVPAGTIEDDDELRARAQVAALDEHSIEASIMKVFGSEALSTVADETLQIFGGAGYIEDYPIERVLRDARINRIFEGTNEINRLLVPGTMLKRAMQGRLALMPFIGRVQAELQAPERIDRTPKEGPLGLEIQQCELAKRATAYAASLVAQKYMQSIPEQQEPLAALADCLILIYGMDSAITRTLQMVVMKGARASAISVAMTRLFVAQSHQRVFALLREMLMWMSEPETWRRQVRDIDAYYSLEPVNALALRQTVAKHMIDHEGYTPY